MQLNYLEFAQPMETPKNGLNHSSITFELNQVQNWNRVFFAKTFKDFKNLNNFLQASDL